MKRRLAPSFSVGSRFKEAALDLFYPSGCVACLEGPGVRHSLCEACWADVIDQSPFISTVQRFPCPPLVASRAYDETASRLIGAFKEESRRDLSVAMARAMCPSAALASQALTDLGHEVVFMPMSSTDAARRRRGFDHMAQVAKQLAQQGGYPVAPSVLRVGAREDSVGLTIAQRFRSARESISVSPHKLPHWNKPGAVVVLLDDVVTTGATMSAATAKLSSAGVAVAGAIVFAAVGETL